MSGAISALLSPIKSIMGAIMPSSPTPPTIAPVTPMPTPDSAAVQAAKQKEIAAQQQSGGRASTVLSQGSDTKSNTLG